MNVVAGSHARARALAEFSVHKLLSFRLNRMAIIYLRHTCALPVIQVKEADHAKCKHY